MPVQLTSYLQVEQPYSYSGHESDDLECYSNGSSDSGASGDDEIVPSVILPSM
jgi:hypothetical protein